MYTNQPKDTIHMERKKELHLGEEKQQNDKMEEKVVNGFLL